jgi:hypothetical protein
MSRSRHPSAVMKRWALVLCLRNFTNRSWPEIHAVLRGIDLPTLPANDPAHSGVFASYQKARHNEQAMALAYKLAVACNVDQAIIPQAWKQLVHPSLQRTA